MQDDNVESVEVVNRKRQLFTTAAQTWKTPTKVYEDLNKEFNFDFDPCPSNPTFDGLKVDWKNSNFVNPPYKTKLQDGFVEKGIEEWKKGKTVVFLIPSRTSTKRFHRLLELGAEFRFIKGRLCFGGSKTPAPFPSMVVVLNGEIYNDNRKTI